MKKNITSILLVVILLGVGGFVAFKVMDEEVWERVKDGELQGFSIECLAELVEMPDDDLDDYLR